ncbi:MAG: Lrp/AsnC family transcriptional regulator [Leptothrix sp. (in: b-proteobacteria)]
MQQHFTATIAAAPPPPAWQPAPAPAPPSPLLAALRPSDDPSAALERALLNHWQRDFPLVPRPFATVAAALGCNEDQVLDGYRRLAARGALSRIGGVWAAGAGGASLLCAMAVEPARLRAVAAQVSAHPGVNHNYAREHRHNLWFVLTSADTATLNTVLTRIEAETGHSVLRLPMRRVYRIDLGFDLERGATAAELPARSRSHGERSRAGAPPVAQADRALAARVEAGLPLQSEPYAVWAAELGCDELALRATLAGWLQQGTLRRFGVVVRHHELGYDCNAMTVFYVPDELVDGHGEALARQPGVTLAYRRAPAPGWPYTLYCMVHGRSRADTLATLHAAVRGARLEHTPHEVLFSQQRFKQTGGRYFRTEPETVDA